VHDLVATTRAAEAAADIESAGAQIVRDVCVIGRVQLVEQREKAFWQPAAFLEPVDSLAAGHFARDPGHVLGQALRFGIVQRSNLNGFGQVDSRVAGPGRDHDDS